MPGRDAASRDSQPIFARIEQFLRSQIDAGTLSVGDRLPSEAHLASQFGTTRLTVRRALDRLAFEGLLDRQVGRGTFLARRMPKRPLETVQEYAVRQSFEEQMRHRGSVVTLEVLGFKRQKAPQHVRKYLNLEADEAVYHLERLRLVDGQPVSLESRFMIQAVGSAVDDSHLTSQSALDLVEGVLEAPVETINVTVFSETATARLADKLGVKRGAALLVREHRFFDRRNCPVVYGKAYFRGDVRFSYVYGRGDMDPAGPPVT